MMMTISSVFLIKIGTDESINKKDDLWDYLKKGDEELYREVRRGVLASALHLPGRPGKAIVEAGYKAAQKIFGFN